MKHVLLPFFLLCFATTGYAQLTDWGASLQQVDSSEHKREPTTRRLTRRVSPATQDPTYQYLSRAFGYPALITYTFNEGRLIRSFVSYRAPSVKSRRFAPVDSITVALVNQFGPPKSTATSEVYWAAAGTYVLQVWSKSSHTVEFQPRKKLK